MMTHNGGSTYPENVAPRCTPYKNLNVIGIAEESSSEDDNIPPSTQSTQSLVSGVDGSGTPSDNCVTEVIYKVQDKDLKGTFSCVNDVCEDVTEDSQATADANNANNESGDSERTDDHHANNLNNNNSDESILDEGLVDHDVPAGNNEFPPDHYVDQVQEVENNQPVPTTDPLAVLDKLYIKEKSGDYKRLISVGVSEAETAEEEEVSSSDNSANVSGEVVEEDMSADSGTSALQNGTSPQVAQETTYNPECQSEMASNRLSFMQLARRKVPPVECTDKSTQKFTEYIQSVLSQSALYYSSDMTRTPQEDSSAVVIATNILPTLLSVNSTSPPVAKDTNAHHKFQKPETVKYSTQAAHAPFKPCYPNNPQQPVHLEDAYRNGSWRHPKLFQCLMGEVDNT